MGEDPKVNGWALGAAAGQLLMTAQRVSFEPSERQAAFRAHMMACWRADIVLSHRWIDLTAKLDEAALKAGIPEWEDTPVTLAEYGRWINVAEFRNWLYEEILPVLEPGSEQRKMVDLVWYAGVIEAMSTGKEWAFKVWETRRDHERKGIDGLPVEGQGQLEEFLSAAAKGDAWKVEA